MNAAAERRGTDSEAGVLARGHVERIRDVLLGLCREAGFVEPEGLADQLVLLIEGAISLRMTRAAEDPAAHARTAAAALCLPTPGLRGRSPRSSRQVDS